jgi:hypothetical protein
MLLMLLLLLLLVCSVGKPSAFVTEHDHEPLEMRQLFHGWYVLIFSSIVHVDNYYR